jgi:hypothetical protein
MVMAFLGKRRHVLVRRTGSHAGYCDGTELVFADRQIALSQNRPSAQGNIIWSWMATLHQIEMQ